VENPFIKNTEDIINSEWATKADTATAQVLALLAIATAIGQLAEQAQTLAEQVQDLVTIANQSTYAMVHGGTDDQDS